MRFLPIFMLACSPYCFALESTALIEVEQAWRKGTTQKSTAELKVEFNHTLSARTEATAIVRAKALGPDSFEPGESDQPALSNVTRRHYINDTVELELRELYADVRLDNGNLRIGKQQIVWGQADGLKLLDVINPQDYREFILDKFEDSRIPVWTLNLEVFLSSGDLQLVWIPDTSRHNLAKAGSAFEVTAPLSAIPPCVPVNIQDIDPPDDPLKDGTFAARFSTFKGGWDLTLNYLYRFDNFPAIAKQIDSTGLTLTPTYHRTNTLGGSASNAFGDFIFRSEAVFNSAIYFDTQLTHQSGIAPAKELAYVLGLDWSGLSNTLMSVQLFQSILLNDDDFLRDKIDTTLTLLARRTFLNESLLTEALWIYHLNDRDHLLRLKADYQWSTNITVGFFADMFSGKEDQLFGQFDQKDQIGLRIEFGL